ncbi:transposase [Enterococcus sp. BWR-S5]|uniref:transposase n=1 Tax=Enterococcus sp. BWR-S5 TaxID=2787714 RepID=UPI0022AAA905|nr:transposase [Enterococcus sp. BWR-S5]
MKQLLSKEKTGAFYRRRKIDVEPVFGFLKAILGFTRLPVRGKEQVKNELGFDLLVVNLRKLTVSQRETTRKKEINRKKERISLFFIQVMILSFFVFRTYVPNSFKYISV